MGFNLITPPQRNSKTSVERQRNKYKASLRAVLNRDRVIEDMRKNGRANWKKSVGYHKRSLAETAIFRFKSLTGSRLKSRKTATQKIEIAIKCAILNKMANLGFGR